MQPPVPPDEAQRLAALRALGILDTPAEERFDRITRVAQRLFDVPIALVSLVDAERQWFKSRQGLTASETGRDISFCGHAIAGTGVFVVPDARADVRFVDNPLVTGAPHIRFYAGVPLASADGHNLGTLCIIDRQPRRLSDADLAVLRDLAALARDELNAVHVGNALVMQKLAEARVRAVLDNVLDGIVTLDEDGTIETCNPAAGRLFGYHDPAEVIGQSFALLLPAAARETYLEYLADYRRTGQTRMLGSVREVDCRRRDGSVFPADVGTSELQVDGRWRLIATVRDATERKRLERLKDEFVSMVSHELRTPLTSINGALSLLAGGVAGPLEARGRELVEVARRNGERLLCLVNDILDIAKIESGKMDFHIEPLELVSLVTETLAATAEYAARFGVRLVLAPAPPVVRVAADRGRLTQVLTNLLSNAAKFSPSGDCVEVAVTRHAGRVQVAVIDHGPGIPPEFHDRLFEKFAQADAGHTRAQGGTGLGLSISKALIECMGGSIGFQTRIGAGSTFCFELPECGEGCT